MLLRLGLTSALVSSLALAFAGCGDAPLDEELGKAAYALSPVNSLPGAQTVSEDAILFFSAANANAITISDPDSTSATINIQVTNGTFTMGATTGLSVSGNGTASVIVTGTIAQINTGLNNARYTPASNFNGSAQLTLTANDSDGGSDLDVLAISVTAVNDAPLNNVPNGTQAATEDVPRNFNSISINDVDVAGAAMTVTLTSSNGTLMTLATTAGLSFDAGDGTADATMTFDGTLANINAALNGMTVIPPLDYIGASTIVITANDNGSTGSGGPGQDTDTVTLSWAAVNDAPVAGVPGMQITAEDTPLAFGSGTGNALGIADVDATSAIAQITLSVTGGTLTLGNAGLVSFSAGDGIADGTMTFQGTLANLNSAMNGTIFTPTANFTGTATLTLLANDLGNSGSGGAKTDTAQVPINVTLINDAPVNTVPGTQSTTEDVARVFSTANGNLLSVNDVDAVSIQVTLTATSGTITLATKTGLTFLAGDGTADVSCSFTGTLTNVRNALNGLSFLPDANFSGTATLQIVSNDQGASGAGGPLEDADSVSILVSPANDPPTALDDAVTVLEDSGTTVINVRGNDTIAPDSGETLTITQVSDPPGGTTSTNGLTVSYTPGANFFGTDIFTYTISDGNGGTAVGTVVVTVTGVNDPPTANDDSFTVLQGSGANAFSVLSNDTIAPDTGETISITAVGTAANGTPAITGGGTGVSYTPAPAFTGTDTFTYTITDSSGSSDTATVTVDVVLGNVPPTNSLPAGQTVNEDSPLFFSTLAGNSITVSDPDNAVLTVQIVVTSGTFTLGSTNLTGLSVTGNGSSSVTLTGPVDRINSVLNNARYNPSNNFNGAATLTMSSNDSSGSTDLDVLNLTVNAFNDPPLNAAPTTTQTATEDTPRTFSNITVSDVDVGAGKLQVTLTADAGTVVTLATRVGLTFTAGDGIADPTMTMTGTVAQLNAALNGLTVIPPTNYVGPSTLTIVTNDQGSTGTGGPFSDTDTVNLSWGAVNDAPVNEVPGPLSTLEEQPLSFTAAAGTRLSLSDSDATVAILQVTLSVTSGTLTLGTPGAVTFTAGDGTSDASMTFQGTISALNAALAGTTFTPAVDFAGNVTLTLLSNDLGNTGSGGARTDSDTVVITVNPVNDAPVNTVPGPQTTNEDVARVFSVTNGNAISVTDIDATALQVTLAVTAGTLTLPTKTGLTFLSGDGTADGSMTMSGTITSLRNALAGLVFQPGANFVGDVTLSITTSDLGATGIGGGLVDVDTVLITVNPVNDPPAASDDSITIAEDSGPATITVLGNDSGLPDSGETLTVTAVSPAGSGTVSTDGVNVTYTPNANFNGVDSFTYTLSDGNGGTDTAVITVTVTSVNDPPTATDDEFTVKENTANNGFTVLSNDTIAPDVAETLSITAAGPAGSGTVTIVGAGTSLTYTPNPGFVGADSFSYTITDSNGSSDTATVTVDVVTGNAPPTNFLPAAQSTAEDSPRSFGAATTNAITVADPDNTNLTVQIVVTNGTFDLVTATPGGTTVLGDNTASVTVIGTVSNINTVLNNALYRPAANFNGVATLTITATDQGGEIDTDVLPITVISQNDPPVNSVPTGNQAVSEDVPKTYTLSVSDVDLGSAPLLVTLTANANTVITLANVAGLSFAVGDGDGDPTMTFSGTVDSVNAALNGLTVIPPPNFIGASTLIMTSNDQGQSGGGGGGDDTDTINMTWSAVNDAPVNTVPPAQIISEDQVMVFNAAAGRVLSMSDDDAAGGLIRVTFSATNGTLSLATLTGLTFTTGDGLGDGNMVFQGNQTNVNNALNGAFYTPTANFNGNATITFRSDDLGNTGSGGAKNDQDTIAVTILPINDAPVNNVPGTQSTPEDTNRVFSVANANLITLSDVDATSLQVTLSAEGGVITLGGTGGLTFATGGGDGTADATMTFSGTITAINAALVNARFIPTPNFFGPATITIFSNDLGVAGAGGALTDVDVITINVAPVNDPPDAVADAVSVEEDGLSVELLVLANDSFLPDAPETLTITAPGTPLHGAASTDGTRIFYTPAANYFGPDSLTYTISDGNGGTDTAVVTITVQPVNDPPDAVDDSVSVVENSSSNAIDALANDAFAPDVGETLSIVSVGTPGSGTVTITGAGTGLSYTPDPGFVGDDAFTYTITDNNGLTDVALVTVTVTAFDYLPEATDDVLTVVEDTPGTVAVLANDTALDDTPVVVTVTTQPLHGTASVNAANEVVYTPAADYAGADSLVYTVTDADGDSDSATVTITVTNTNDLPVAADDNATTAEDTPVTITVLANDSKVVDPTITLTITTTPSNGTATVQPADNTVVYTPGLDFHGTDTFVYEVTDGNGDKTTATVQVSVTSVNDNPVAVADMAAARPGEPVDIMVLANDSDVDVGDTLTVTTASTPGNGTAQVVAGGAIRYTPNPAFGGTDVFTYEISDGNGGTAQATVTVGVGTDTDGDGLIDADELDLGTDPNDVDTDDDGLEDGPEVDVTLTSPLDDDTDDDGLMDGSEDANANGVVDAGETSANDADTDGDGLGDGVELGLTAAEGEDSAGFVGDADPATTTDPRDDDSDDDGLLDGSEDANADGERGDTELDPGNADSDADGLTDGVESSLTAPEGDDTDSGAFVADADPSTSTNPLVPDTDGGGIYDGTEDVNRNGAVDEGETDPNDPSDDKPAGCGCRSAAGATSGADLATLLLVVLAVLVPRRRRRRA